jgi:hypothetical protein
MGHQMSLTLVEPCVLSRAVMIRDDVVVLVIILRRWGRVRYDLTDLHAMTSENATCIRVSAPAIDE